MISAAFNAFTEVLKAPKVLSKYKLWSFTIIPFVLSILLFTITFGAAWSFADSLGDWLFGWYKWEFGQGFIDKAENWVGGFIILAFALLTFKYLLLILISPFMSLLSERMEDRMYGEKEVPFKMSRFLADFARGVRISLRNIFKELLLTLLLLIVGIIPLVGFISPVLIFLVQAYYAGFGNMDFSLERHFDVKNSALFVKQNKGLALGNGTAFILCLLVPVVGVIFGPVLTSVAASHQTLQLIHESEEFV